MVYCSPVNNRYSVAPESLLKASRSNFIVEKFNYGLFDSFFRFVRKKPKVFILMVSSLVLTFTLIILVPILRELIDRLMEKRHATQFNYKVYTFYTDLCSLKRNFLVENYVFIFFSFPLTIFLYFWNSFHLERKKKSPKKKRVKSKKVPIIEDNANSSSDEEISPKKLEALSSKEKEVSKINSKGRLGLNFDLKLLVPMNPFAKNNRLITCIIYAAYIHNISKIFEFSFADFNLVDFNKLTKESNRSNETG